MEIYNQTKDIKVFGMQVKTFPTGIGEAFEALAKNIEDGYNRSYYGISYFDKDGAIIYKAAAEEKNEGEAEKYNYEQFTIENGDYIMIRVKEWRKKTDNLKEVFYELMQDRK